MSKYHITEDGPKKCTASVRDCKYGSAGGGGHYANEKEAQAAFEKSMGGGVSKPVSKRTATPKDGEKYAKAIETIESMKKLVFLPETKQEWYKPSFMSNKALMSKTHQEWVELNKDLKETVNTLEDDAVKLDDELSSNPLMKRYIELSHAFTIGDPDHNNEEMRKEASQILETLKQDEEFVKKATTFDEKLAVISRAKVYRDYTEIAMGLSKTRVYKGITIPPGQDLFIAAYDLNGELLAPETDNSYYTAKRVTDSNGATLKVRPSQHKDDDKRRQNNRKKGYTMGLALAPAKITSDYSARNSGKTVDFEKLESLGVEVSDRKEYKRYKTKLESNFARSKEPYFGGLSNKAVVIDGKTAKSFVKAATPTSIKEY